MNILIVDDESFSIMAIRKKIKWNYLCEDEIHVYEAYNTEQAREVIKEKDIDIMLCDIEMPGENGIELIRWVREKQISMEILIITCHEEFHYAKEAIQLNVRDYCVKPIDFKEMEGILRVLLQKRKFECEQREKNQYADYWMEEKENLKTQFWYEFLTQTESGRILKSANAKKFGLPIMDTDQFTSAVITIRKYEVSIVKWDRNKMERSIRNLIREVMKETECEIVLGIKNHIVVISRNGDDYMEKCEELVRLSDELFHIKICCYVGTKTYFMKLPEKIDELIECLETDVSHQSGVFAPKDVLNGKQMGELRLSKELQEKLEKCQFSEFRVGFHVWIKENCKQKDCSREGLVRIRESLQLIFYGHLQKLHMNAEQIYEDPQRKMLYEESIKLIDSLEEWADMVTEYLEGKYEEQLATHMNERIQKVKEYIEQNLEEELTRQEIAQAVFLNQDYLARVFKERENCSIMEYLTKRRIEKAIELMLLKSENRQKCNQRRKKGYSYMLLARGRRRVSQYH